MKLLNECMNACHLCQAHHAKTLLRLTQESPGATLAHVALSSEREDVKEDGKKGRKKKWEVSGERRKRYPANNQP